MNIYIYIYSILSEADDGTGGNFRGKQVADTAEAGALIEVLGVAFHVVVRLAQGRRQDVVRQHTHLRRVFFFEH